MYRFVSFDGLALPHVNTESDQGTGNTRVGVVSYGNGVINPNRAIKAPLELPYTLSLRCEIVGTNIGLLYQQLEALTTKRGYTGRLVRERIDGMGYEHWAEATLVRVPRVRDVRNVYFHPLTLVFLVQSYWHIASATVYNGSITDTVTLALANNGQIPVTSVTLRLTAPSSAPMPEIRIWRADYATHIGYMAGVAAGKEWELDTASWLVTNDGVADPDNLHLLSGHRRANLMEIMPGGSNYTIEIVGGTAAGSYHIMYDELYE